MNLQNWIREAKAHWKEHSPKLYRQLEKAGTLDARLKDAAERTEQEMSDLMKEGFQHHEAWEMTREKYLFTPQERPPKDEAPASEAVRLSMEANKLRNQMLEQHHEIQ